MAETVQDVLRAWGRSKAINEAPNGYSTSQLAKQMQSPGDSAEKASIISPLTDDYHVLVDSVVSEMKPKKPDHHRVIVYAYRYGYSDDRIARYVTWAGHGGKQEKRSRSWVRAMRENAEFWIEAKLD